MNTLKQESIVAIAKLPDSANIDDIMYLLDVIHKVRKGKEAIGYGNVVSANDLKKEIKTW